MSEEEGKVSDHDLGMIVTTRKNAISEERLQDLLMPGLRHAHTLQQLRVIT